jgi:ADP-ribosylation factor protein 1
MGSGWSVFGRELKIIIAGVSGTGRTTVLYKLKDGGDISTIHTIGFHMETVKHRGNSCIMFEVGDQDKHRPFWREWWQKVEGLIFVVDSTEENFEETKEELQFRLQDDKLSSAPLLILANKQDLPDALSAAKLTRVLELDLIKDRPWHIEPTSATSGMGLHNGLDWLVDQAE